MVAFQAFCLDETLVLLHAQMPLVLVFGFFVEQGKLAFVARGKVRCVSKVSGKKYNPKTYLCRASRSSRE